jgi:hypothetical protein
MNATRIVPSLMCSAGLERFGEPLADIRTDLQPVDDGLDDVLFLRVERGRRRVRHLAVDAGADEALGAQFLDQLLMAPLRSWTTGASSIRRVPPAVEDVVDHLADGLRRQRRAVRRAARLAGAREQQSQVVVDLGDGADRRTRVVRDRLLLDRDRRRQAVDMVDIRFLHDRKELARVTRQRLDIAALAFGVDRVEGE